MDVVMVVGSVLLLVLVLFLLFVFAVAAASLFVKRRYGSYEPRVSIVIPAYNEAQNIAACLDAVFASDYPQEKREVIVVDDGSRDDSVAIAKSYPSVRLLQQQHEGKTAALNLGVKAAAHDFILALDADTTIERQCIRELVKPLQDAGIGATTGVSKVKNKDSILGMFQNIEYHYNNLIRNSFSLVFRNGIWFFGALACYRKSVLEQVGYFKRDTLTEDMDIALEMKKAGYRTYSVKDAAGYTVVPETWSAFYQQRKRWWMGVLQALVKNRALFSLKSSPSVLFLYINQFWWSVYAIFSLPLILYQVNYWLPYNSGSLLSIFSYLFRWFSLSGPLYVVYKIPEWGLSVYSVFGVMAGIISAALILASIRLFRDRFSVRNLAAVFFYFPYTIALNMVIFISLLRFRSMKTRFFVK